MIRKTSIVAAVVLGAASFAFADTREVFVGGHNHATYTRTEIRPAAAPYALTGSEHVAKSNQTQNLWVGNRFVGATVVQK